MAPDKSPSDDVTVDEELLRRVPPTWWPSQDAPSPVSAFRPRAPNRKRPGDQGDVDGLSVSRQIFTSAETASNHQGKRYHVVSLLAKTIREGGVVSIVPKPLLNDLGHCVLPEINITDYESDKKDVIELQAERLRNAATVVVRA